jgi:hypothetical protein
MELPGHLRIIIWSMVAQALSNKTHVDARMIVSKGQMADAD